MTYDYSRTLQSYVILIKSLCFCERHIGYWYSIRRLCFILNSLLDADVLQQQINASNINHLFLLNTLQPTCAQKIRFNVVKAGKSVNQCAVMYKWMWVIVTVSVVHSCLYCMKSFSFTSLNPCSIWSQQDWYVDKSAASEKCCARAQCRYAPPFTVFTFIKSPDDTRLLQ